MSINPQSQSTFVTRLVSLPPEIRDAIYLELWRSHGLRQHIVRHGKEDDRHFCSWPCTTEYQVEDILQRDVEELRCRLGIPIGEDMGSYGLERNPEVTALTRRLQTPWFNHWACGERAWKEHGVDAFSGITTSRIGCWKKSEGKEKKDRVATRSPYLPMLLSCKLLSEQSLKSIYESTTFIFTDMTALQMFLGRCHLHPAISKWPNPHTTPPGLLKYTGTLELSLSPDFPSSVNCANYGLPGMEGRHEVYDFHWLHLDRFQNLRNLDIWVSARSVNMSLKYTDETYDFTGITEFDVNALQKVLAHLDPVAKVTLSTPLGESVGPEEGYVEGFKARVYKRGSGDRFHPPLYPIQLGGIFDGVIHTSSTGDVRLSRNANVYVAMKSV